MKRLGPFAALVVLLVLPTCGTSGSDGVSRNSDAPPPPGKVLFKDDFSSDKNKWTVLDPKAGAAEVEDQRLKLFPSLDHLGGPLLAVAESQKDKKLADVTIEADIAFNPKHDNEDSGVVCRASGGDRRYAFTIGRFGNYDIGFRSGETSRGLSYGEHKAIKKSPAVNKLRVDCHGDVLSMWVNGQLVARVQDSTIRAAGFVGVRSTWLHQRSDVAGAYVDNFTVRRLTGREPAVAKAKASKPSGTLIYNDAFNSPAWLGGSPSREGDNFSVGYVAEKLQIRVSGNSGATVDSSEVLDLNGTPLKDLTDVSVETEITMPEGSSRATAGVWCRRANPAAQAYYAALIYPGLQEFAIVRWNLLEATQQPEAVFMRGGFSKQIATGAATNRIRMDCVGDRITLAIKDVVVASVQDSTHKSGSVGTFAESAQDQPTVAQFDELKIRKPDEKVAAQDSRAKLVQDHLDANFTGTTWYPHIKRVHVSSNVVWVDTDLVSDEDSREPASAICRAVSSYVFSKENTVGLTGVNVRASSGEQLVLRTSVSESC